jgi:toxin YhaV
MKAPIAAAPLVVNGWSILAHPLFCDQVERLTERVELLRQKDPANYGKRNDSKRLAAIGKLAFEVIPQNPAGQEFRQGNTLGASHSHWLRAKFFGQYRLFFRFHSEAKVIVLAWVNDESTLRARESDDDAYRVFRKMLERGNPPTDWDQLLAAARAADTADRLRRISASIAKPAAAERG